MLERKVCTRGCSLASLAAFAALTFSGCGQNAPSPKEIGLLKYDHPTQPTQNGVDFVERIGRETVPLPEGATGGNASTFYQRSDGNFEIRGSVWYADPLVSHEALWIVASGEPEVQIFVGQSQQK